MKEYTVEVVVEHRYRVSIQGRDEFNACNNAIGYVMDNEEKLDELYSDAHVAKYFLPDTQKWVEIE